MRYAKNGSRLRKRVNTEDEIWIWETVALLLEQQRTADEILTLIRTKKTARLCDRIRFELMEGADAEKIVESIPGKTAARMRFYLRFLPFSQAVKNALELVKMEESLKKKLLKAAAYPAFVLVLAMGVLMIFTHMVLPQLNEFMTEFQSDAGVSFTLVKAAEILMDVLAAGSLVVILVFLWFKTADMMLPLWKAFHKVKGDGLFRQIWGYRFAAYLAQLCETGLSTRRSLQLIRQYNRDPCMVFLAEGFEEGLQEGKEFTDLLEWEYLDERFRFMASIGYTSGTFAQRMREYCAFSEKDLERKISGFSGLVQIISYAGIGLIVVLVYECMLGPLEAMGAF